MLWVYAHRLQEERTDLSFNDFGEPTRLNPAQLRRIRPNSAHPSKAISKNRLTPH